MDIDPLETVIVWLATNLTSAQGRVAGKHRYGVAWTAEQVGVSVQMDNGAPDIGKTSISRFEIRIYGKQRPDIFDVWRELIELSKVSTRFVVPTSLGDALVHYFLQVSGFSMVYEKDLNMDVGIVFFESLVADSAVD